jgi:hypothetical protein
MDRMMGSVEPTIGANEHVVTKGDLAGIHKNTIIVGKEVIAYLDVEAKAAENVWLYIRADSAFTEELADQFFPALLIGG